jgi:hypothetical protein
MKVTVPWQYWIADVRKGEDAEELFFDHKAQGLNWKTIRSLKRAGLFEKMILAMHVQDQLKKGGRLCYLTDENVDTLWNECDPKRLRAAGEHIPATKESITLYRGLSGLTRDITGASWTDTLGIACRFAIRFHQGRVVDTLGHDPAVYTVTVKVANVLAYLNRTKGEREFLFRAQEAEVARLPFDYGEICWSVDGWGWDEHWRMRRRAR